MKSFEDLYKHKKEKKSMTEPSKDQIMSQAFKFHSQGNIVEAAKYYQDFINRGFENHAVFSNYGAILKSSGKLKEAELATRKAIKLNPEYAEAHYNLGIILKNLGKLKEAESSYHKAIELNPNYAIAFCNLGNILKDRGKLKEAELAIRKAIKLNPDYAIAYSNLGSILKDRGKLKEAELAIHKAIKLNSNNAETHYKLGIILKDRGKLKEAESSYHKAIELNPNYAMALSNLGSISIDLGKLKEAESYTLRAIEINPDLAKAYFCISSLQYSNGNKIWQDQLFSENILINKSQKDLIDIYFARANVLHKEKKYTESSRYLKLANKLKSIHTISNAEEILNQSKMLLIESNKKNIKKEDKVNYPQNIFIVGMPRSGSTLLESILSINIKVNDLGETLKFHESFLEYKNNKNRTNLAELYLEKTQNLKMESRVTTNKNLYNYLYTGIICDLIPNAQIIHTFRNPLDNILSIYRANFSTRKQYYSSLVDCAKVYLDHEEVMTKYKMRFRAKIYDLNYDSLVRNPHNEIKSLISWLGWQWDDKYLSPHLNQRSVSTASAVAVRSPINSKSIGGWKNYKEMLKPAMEIITQSQKYKVLRN